MRSKIYKQDFILQYTSVTETDISKLYRACVMDEQASLVSFMLRNNPTLINIRLSRPESQQSYDAFQYVQFHKESLYLPKIWEVFAAPNIKHDKIDASNQITQKVFADAELDLSRKFYQACVSSHGFDLTMSILKFNPNFVTKPLVRAEKDEEFLEKVN